MFLFLTGDGEEITFLMVQWWEQLLSVGANGFGQSRTLGVVKDTADNERAAAVKDIQRSVGSAPQSKQVQGWETLF